MWLLRPGHKKHCGFLLAVFFGSVAMEEASCHSQEHLSSLVETSAWWEVEASYYQPLGVSHFGNKSPVHSGQIFRWLQLPHCDTMLKYPEEASSSSIISLATGMMRTQPSCSTHLFRFLGRPVGTLRNIAWPMRSFFWFLQKLSLVSPGSFIVLIFFLGCWDPNSCWDQRGNEILYSLSDCGICSQLADPAADWPQHSWPPEKELWLD